MSDNEEDNFGKCCIGVVIVALILTGVYMIFYDGADKSADVIIDGKKITLHNLTQNQINNKIDGIIVIPLLFIMVMMNILI